MKSFVRLVGLLGGFAAVVWAMRDRFISLTVPREPEPPVFRPTPDSREASPAPPPRSEDDLTEVTGIGPVFAGRLRDAGVTSFSALAAMSDDDLAEVLGSSLGRIPTILEDARRLAGA